MIVRDGVTLGEGYHRRRGDAHAEVEALRDAQSRGHDVRGATMVVSLEPCNHHGRTPPCSEALIAARIARVVIGAADPNPKTARGGIERLRAAGIDVAELAEPRAEALIEAFGVSIRVKRPYVTLKMAGSLDGCVAPAPGSYWLTGPAARERVRELRIAHDAVMVGAGTVRVDDPQLTVRPYHHRRKPYARVVVCERDPVPVESSVFAQPVPLDSYRRTIVLAPAGARDRFAALEEWAECLYVGDATASVLDLRAALAALREAGVSTVLCEGGPTLAAALLAAGLVDRLVWFVAPALLRNPRAVPVLQGDATRFSSGWEFETVERCGEDLLLTAKLSADV